jgi:uncharacterized protein YndB with AHSA1/START domain
MEQGALPDMEHSVVLDYPVQAVWGAVASAEGLAGWFMPNSMVLEPMREFTLHAGPFGDSPCRVSEVADLSHWSFKWDDDWMVIFRVQSLGSNRTRLTLTHGG